MNEACKMFSLFCSTLFISGCFRLGLDTRNLSTDADTFDSENHNISDGSHDGSDHDDTYSDSDIDYDDDTSDVDDDIDSSSNFILSMTKLSDSDSSSYVEIDVDWSRELAYLSTQEPGVCFDIVDFSDENEPVLLRRMGPHSSPPTTCDMSRGLQLFDGGTKLLVGSHGPGVIEVWDLGSDPRAQSYTQIAELSIGHVRRVAAIDESDDDVVFYMSVRSGVRSFELAPPTLVPLGSWTGTDNQADAAVVDRSFFLTASWIADAPISIINISTMDLFDTFDMTNGVNDNGLWSATVSADQSRAFFGGWVSAFIGYDSGLPNPLFMTRRFDNDSTYRDAIFVEDEGQTYLYALRSDLVLDVFNTSDINSPSLEYQTNIPVGHAECYGLRVNTTTRRIIMITSAGEMIIAHMDRMTPTSYRYPDF